MRVFKRVTALLCAVTLLLTVGLPAYAEPRGLDSYTRLMSGLGNACYMTCQPDSALVLDTVIDLTSMSFFIM